MRIVYVTSRFPYPIEKGDKLRAFHQIRVLSRQHEIHLVSLSHRQVAPEEMKAMEPFCKSIQIFYINKWLFAFQLLLGWMEGLPLQVSYFLDRSIKRRLQYHIIRLEPDHIVCQLIRAVPYVQSLPFHKTLDYMDVFSEGMRQLAARYGFLGFPFRWEAGRLAKYERTVYKDFDHHTIISMQDRGRLKLASASRVVIVPNGVDESFQPSSPPVKPAFTLVFVGNLGYGPNIEAVTKLTRELLPLLRKDRPEINLLVSGARPASRIKRISGIEGVTLRGWIEDIREAYSDGRIFVAPMFSGLGLQNKILEAMAMARPCITTSMVNNAIGAEAGKEILLADTLEGMRDHIFKLLDDAAYYEEMARAGRKFVQEKYTWEAQVAKLDACIQTKNVFA